MSLADKLILAFYVDKRGMEHHEVVENINLLKKNVSHLEDSGVAMFFIAIDGESRVECVNPVLVTDEEAKVSFNAAVGRLNEVVNSIQNKEEDEQSSEK